MSTVQSGCVCNFYAADIMGLVYIHDGDCLMFPLFGACSMETVTRPCEFGVEEGSTFMRNFVYYSQTVLTVGIFAM